MPYNEALENWRKEHNYSHDAIARIACVAHGTAKNWCRGYGAGPTIEQLRKLEEASPGLVARIFPAVAKAS